MTTVSLKLTGYSNDKLIKFDKDDITILDIYSYLIDNEMLFNEISQIIFINNGKNINNDTSTLYTGTNEYPLVIHLFTNSLKIKNEVIKCIFKNRNDTELLEPHNLSELSESPEVEFHDVIDNIKSNDSDNDYSDNNFEEVSEEETNQHNLKLIELFSDKDFVYLLNILINKPELINMASSYILNGSVINNFELKEFIGEFKYDTQLAQILELLNKLNKEYDENELKFIINNFEGNLNLSLRYILNKF
jgi:hypothetical protein